MASEFEQRLGELQPVCPQVNRDRLMFLAGHQAAERRGSGLRQGLVVFAAAGLAFYLGMATHWGSGERTMARQGPATPVDVTSSEGPSLFLLQQQVTERGDLP